MLTLMVRRTPLQPELGAKVETEFDRTGIAGSGSSGPVLVGILGLLSLSILI